MLLTQSLKFELKVSVHVDFEIAKQRSMPSSAQNSVKEVYLSFSKNSDRFIWPTGNFPAQLVDGEPRAKNANSGSQKNALGLIVPF